MTATANFSHIEDLETDMIKGNPWVLELFERGQILFRKIFLNGIKVIQDIDSSEEFGKIHGEKFLQCLEDKMNDAKSYLDLMYEHHINKIVSLFDTVATLEKKLELTASATEQEFFTESLVEIQKKLKTTVEEYQKMVDIQNKQFEELNKKHAFYAYKLGKSPKRLSAVQSKTSLEEFKTRIEKLETEFSNRQERYNAIKSDIEEINRETEIVPEGKWAELCDDSIKVSDEMMQKIEDFYKEIISTRDGLFREMDESNKELEKLWKLLQIPPEEQKAFVDTLNGYSKTSLKKIQSEVAKLLKIKETKLPEIIERQKCQIQELWDRCHCDSTAKHSFPFIYSTAYSEQLCSKFHDEINKWEQYYEQNIDILEQLEEYKKLQNSLTEIDLNMRGVKFYENRGGSLLSTIKKKNILTSRLATAEKKLLYLSTNYFKSNNKDFLTFGMTIQNFLSKQKKIQKLSQNSQEDPTKLTVLKKSHSVMKSPQFDSAKKIPQKKLHSKHTFRSPLPVDSRGTRTRPNIKTSTLPKFKLNQCTAKGSTSKEWKPSKIEPNESEASEDEDSWISYSDFEKRVTKYSSQSTISKDAEEEGNT